MDDFNYKRRYASVAQIGNTPLGGASPIRIQSMANVSTMDTDAAVGQAIRMIDAGAEYVRFTAQGEREARNLRHIREMLHKKGYNTPLVADIHFNPKAADVAALYVEKVRINPGNYVDKVRRFETRAYTEEEYTCELRKIRERFVPFLRLCRENETAIRIGVNHGSLSDRIMSRYGDTPEGLVESCMEFLRLCAEEQFENVVVSIKASNTVVMIRTVRLLVRVMTSEGMCYPLHLGVTEAGDGEDGRIKSAVGIGTLLADGYGDTIRVSLSEEPEAEMPVAHKLIQYISARENHPPITGVPSPLFDPIRPSRRKTRVVYGVGGEMPPVVVVRDTDKTSRSFGADWVYVCDDAVLEKEPGGKYIVDAKGWSSGCGAMPCFSVTEMDALRQCEADAKFLLLTYHDLTEEVLRLLCTDHKVVVIFYSAHPHFVGKARAFMHRLLDAGCDVPVLFRREYEDTDAESLQVKAAADFGALLIDGFGDGLLLEQSCLCGSDARTLVHYMFGVLQATRVRISRTEYISCPGCGRTLFNLQQTIARVKAATGHLTGLKIAIMGCIVNGPGEMADADYGYVGAGRGRISLYKNKKCVLKNIPEEDAVVQLLALINSDIEALNR